MRTFIIVSHTVPASGDWGLEDLAGGAGRVDVLCRAVSSALFVSHGIRDDTRVILVFTADPDEPVAIRIAGDQVRHLNPDERSTAARIRTALQARHPDPWWEDGEPGIEVAPFGLADILDDLGAPVLVLEREGVDARAKPVPDRAAFVLSDHQPFTDDEIRLLRDRATGSVSMGPTWYHGHQAIGVLQWILDGQEAA